MDERRFDMLAAAYVRGCALETGAPELPARLADAPLEELDEADWPHCSGPGQPRG
ncbi:MAG: hypothetical protein ACLUEK_09845 [Oscillospiraceae bacterium]